MIITYQGDNYFKLQSGDTAVLVDPTDQRSYRGANLILNTLRPGLAEPPSDDQGAFWIDHAGEYEVEGIRISGWTLDSEEYEGEKREKTAYLLDFKGFRFAFFGYLGGEPDAEALEDMEEVDVMFIPADGDEFISASKAGSLVRQIEPSLVIPAVFGSEDSLLKELNKKSCKKEEKIVIKKKNLKAGAMEVRCLKK